MKFNYRKKPAPTIKDSSDNICNCRSALWFGSGL
jgi:hypothetical protein